MTNTNTPANDAAELVRQYGSDDALKVARVNSMADVRRAGRVHWCAVVALLEQSTTLTPANSDVGASRECTHSAGRLDGECVTCGHVAAISARAELDAAGRNTPIRLPVTRGLGAVLAALILSACTLTTEPTPLPTPHAAIVGGWQLVSVNGKYPPAMLGTPTDSLYITNAVACFRPNGSYSVSRIGGRQDSGLVPNAIGTASTADSVTYALAGGIVGTVRRDGPALLLAVPGDGAVYRFLDGGEYVRANCLG